MFKQLLLFKRIRELENLVIKNAHYGSIDLNWSDGRGTWTGKAFLREGWKIEVGINEGLTLLEVIEKLKEQIK